MIDPEHKLPISKQTKILQISRSSVYYQPRPVSEADLWLMRRIDELHLSYPFAGRRMLRDLLRQQGLEVGRRHVKTLMKRICIEAIYRKPNTSKAAPGHRICPYLLRGTAITHHFTSEASKKNLPQERRVLAPHGLSGQIEPNGLTLGGGFGEQ